MPAIVAPGGYAITSRLRGTFGAVKKLIELLICILLHPVAVVLIWIDLFTRRDMGAAGKLLWAIFVLIIPIILPVLYIFTGGDLW
jgi:hypothetical protein